MIKRVLKQLKKLNSDKSKLIVEHSKLQKKIDDIDIEIRNYTVLKKEYEKIEKRFNDLTQPKEAKEE